MGSWTVGRVGETQGAWAGTSRAGGALGPWCCVILHQPFAL